MTVPGVNLICAASFIAAIGRPERFFTSRKLVAYLGLDPKVKQSGEGPARSGRISKRGSAAPGGRWSRPRGRPSSSPARCAASLSAPAGGAVTAKRPSPPPAHSRSCSGACSPARGLRPPTPLINAQEAPEAGDHRRRPKSAHEGRRRDLEHQSRDPRHRALNCPCQAESPTSGWSPTSKLEHRREKWARARHWSAHTSGPRRAKLRGKLKAPDVCTSLRQSPAPTRQPTPPQARWQDRRQTPGCPNTGQDAPIDTSPDQNRAHRRRSNALRDHHPTRCTPKKSPPKT